MSECSDGGGGGGMPVSNHAIIVAKWQNCERLMTMHKIKCLLDLEKSQFDLQKELETQKNSELPEREKLYRDMQRIDTVRELELFLLGYEDGRGV